MISHLSCYVLCDRCGNPASVGDDPLKAHANARAEGFVRQGRKDICLKCSQAVGPLPGGDVVSGGPSEEVIRAALREYAESSDSVVAIAERYGMKVGKLASLANQRGVLRAKRAAKRGRWNITDEAWEVVREAYPTSEPVGDISRRAEVPVSGIVWMAKQLKVSRPKARRKGSLPEEAS